jgi:hypothetical protein
MQNVAYMLWVYCFSGGIRMTILDGIVRKSGMRRKFRDRVVDGRDCLDFARAIRGGERAGNCGFNGPGGEQWVTPSAAVNMHEVLRSGVSFRSRKRSSQSLN